MTGISTNGKQNHGGRKLLKLEAPGGFLLVKAVHMAQTKVEVWRNLESKYCGSKVRTM